MNYIGYTSITFGATGVTLAAFFGYLTKYIPQAALIVFMLMVSIANSLFMLTWTPNPNHLYVIFFMAIAFGLSQAYSTGQLISLYIIHVTENKNVFCFCNIFQNIGFLLGFLLSRFTCTYFKAYFYLSLSILSLISYIFLIFLENTELIKEANKKKNGNRIEEK
jgi:hypothetical protein